MGRPSTYVQGTQYGRLTAVEKLPNNRALCRCSCGTKKSINLVHLKRGLIRSCGCLHKEISATLMAKMNTKHGKFGTPIYGVWRGMLGRCHSPTHRAYKDYGARGIKVCKRWHKFENFCADMGDAPTGMTLERKNNNRGYMPSNCTWATSKEQGNNRRSCVQLTYKGTTKNITQWAEHLSVPRDLLYSRHKAGWPTEKILTTPKRGV